MAPSGIQLVRSACESAQSQWGRAWEQRPRRLLQQGPRGTAQVGGLDALEVDADNAGWQCAQWRRGSADHGRPT